MGRLDTYTQLIRERVGDDNGVVEKNIKIHITDIKEVIFIHARSKPNKVHNEDLEADLTISLESKYFEQLMTKEVAGPMLLLAGKMKIKGQVSVAMKMDDILKISTLPPANL